MITNAESDAERITIVFIMLMQSHTKRASWIGFGNLFVKCLCLELCILLSVYCLIWLYVLDTKRKFVKFRAQEKRVNGVCVLFFIIFIGSSNWICPRLALDTQFHLGNRKEKQTNTNWRGIGPKDWAYQ